MFIFRKKQEEKGAIQEKLEESMIGLFEQVIKDRGRYYSNNSDKIPNPENVDSIINSYANQNAVISGGSGLVPGPMGVLTIVPELIFVIRNQLSMVYDIGVAYGHKNKLNAELLISVFGYALGSGALGLMVIHSQKILVRRASLKLMQKMVHLMAGKVTQRVLKSMVGRWIPVAGAVALATWSKLSTHLISKRAISIFEKEIELSEEFAREDFSASTIDADFVASLDQPDLEVIKMQSLINLICIDGVVKKEEEGFISDMINDSNFDGETQELLMQQLKNRSKVKVNYSQITNEPDEAVGLMADLVALAKRDGDFHITEKLFIKQIGKLLDFSSSEIEEVLATC
jgi:hypothetical protein